MILFKGDYAKMPTAEPDYTTTNTSFLELSRLYYDMNVTNCVFILTLLQAELQGIDPHSENLTLEQKTRIGVECRLNPWYYFRECVRIPGIASNESIKFKANRGNIALIWSFMNHIDFMLIQPRQTGKSVSTDTLICWLMFIGCVNTLINMITKDNELRVKNVERLKKIRDLLPNYLVPRSKRDPDNQHEIRCLALDNHYQTGVSQASEAGANKLGRGLTSPICHFDEVPFINHIGITLPAALSSGNAAREEAIKFNRPYGNIFTTTAGKKDDRDGSFVYGILADAAKWDECYYDAKDREELLKFISANMAGNKIIINGTFSHRQLGFTDQHMYKLMVESASTGDAANRDYFNVWTSGSQGSPLSPALNEKIRKSEKEVKYRMISDAGFIVKWYVSKAELEERNRNSKIIVGLDTSDGIGRDGIGVVFTDAYDLTVLGVFVTNETNLITFTKFIVEMMIKFPSFILIPERKSTAQTIIDMLLIELPLAGEDPFKRIYNVIVDEFATREEDYKRIRGEASKRNNAFYEHYKRFFGFVTTGASRDVLYQQVLQNAAKTAGHLVNDPNLSSEIRGLTIRNNRIDHSANSHDDLVIAWMLTHWMLTHSKNLSYYGIDSLRLSRALMVDNENPLTAEQELEMEQQQQLVAEMNAIIEELDGEVDDIKAMRLEHRLRVVYMKLRPSEKQAITLDSVIRDAAEKRSLRRRVKGRREMDLNMDNVWRGTGRNSPTRRHAGNINYA